MRQLVPHFIHSKYRAGRFSGQFRAASLFVDISGFTTITETLMAHKKPGAEVLTDALNSVFNSLVHHVYAHGGFISGFAGDAFTALFPIRRKQAALYATRTAFLVQQFFEQHDTAETEYGNFTLGARCGLGIGTVHWGILGQEGRFAHFFRGDAIDRCTRAEGHAQTGDIVAAQDLMPLLNGYVEARPVGTHFVISKHTLDLPLKPDRTVRLSRQDLQPFVLDAVIDLDLGAEFRDIASVFISLGEPKDAATLDAFVGQVLTIAYSYGGYFNKLIFGDKGGVIVVLFGAPVAYENNLERAADFLLSLQASVSGMRWRAGLTTGTVYAGFIGGAEQCEYTAIGDIVNFSDRLMTRADWGEIWSSPATAAQLATRHYQFEAAGQFAFKGKSEAVAVSRLTGGPETRSKVSSYAGIFVGRETELDTLAQWVEPVFAGRFAGLITVFGEAGIGKSRLIDNLRQRIAPPERLGWFLCPADGTLRQSLNPFKHFLRRHFDQSPSRSTKENLGRFDAVLDELIASLPPSEADGLGAQVARMRPFLGAMVDLHWEGSFYEQLEPELRLENSLAAFKALVKAESLRRPVAVHIEDAHWLDRDSQMLLQTLTRNVESFPFAIVVTSRYQDDGSALALPVDERVVQRSIDLTPLSLENVQAIITQVLGGEVSKDLVSFLAQKSNGNPFFCEQLALDLRERNVLQRNASGAWDIEQQEMVQVPTSINTVLVARLDRLAARVKAVVQTASVLGQEFEIRVLAQMLEGDLGLPTKVKLAEEAAIWQALSEMRYIFKHALLCDAAYGMQLHARLRALHHLAAESIERIYAADLTPHYAQLAYHFARADDKAHEGKYARLAGEQAYRICSYREALRSFERALELLPADSPARGSITSQIGQVLIPLGEYDRAQQYLETALALTPQVEDDASCIDALTHLGTVARKRGDYVTAREQLEEATVLARRVGEQAKLARALYHLSWVDIRQGDYSVAKAKLTESYALWQALGDRYGLSRALVGLGSVAHISAEYGQAREHFAESLALCREFGDRGGMAVNLNNLGETAQIQGDYATAQRHYQEALGILKEIGDAASIAGVLGNLGHVTFALQDTATAELFYQEALSLAIGVGALPRVLESIAGLARILAHTGQPERAIELLGLVLAHPALTDEAQQHIVEPTLAVLRDGLPAQEVQAALERGQARELDDVVAELV